MSQHPSYHLSFQRTGLHQRHKDRQLFLSPILSLQHMRLAVIPTHRTWGIKKDIGNKRNHDRLSFLLQVPRLRNFLPELKIANFSLKLPKTHSLKLPKTTNFSRHTGQTEINITAKSYRKI